MSYIDEVHSAGMHGPVGAGEGASHRIDVMLFLIGTPCAIYFLARGGGRSSSQALAA